jgi:hypothetical protein
MAELKDTQLIMLSAVGELRRRWLEPYGTPAPKFFRSELLVRAVAYQMQVKVHGGLSPCFWLTI